MAFNAMQSNQQMVSFETPEKRYKISFKHKIELCTLVKVVNWLLKTKCSRFDRYSDKIGVGFCLLSTLLNGKLSGAAYTKRTQNAADKQTKHRIIFFNEMNANSAQ